MGALSARALGAFVVLVFMQTTAILLFKLCQEDGLYTFSPASSIVMSEVAKLVMSTTFHYRSVGRAQFFEGLTPVIVGNYAGLSLLYTTNNYITFRVHLVADPGTYTLGKSVTPYVVAVLLWATGQRLHELQWLCIVIQCCGIAVTQYDPCATSTTGQEKGAKFPTSKAHISVVFHSFWLIFGRVIISRNGLERECLSLEHARAERPR